MNIQMTAAAQVIARAGDVVSEGGALTRDKYWDNKFDWTNKVVVPTEVFDALKEALDDYHELCAMAAEEARSDQAIEQMELDRDLEVDRRARG